MIKIKTLQVHDTQIHEFLIQQVTSFEGSEEADSGRYTCGRYSIHVRKGYSPLDVLHMPVICTMYYFRHKI